MTGKALAATLVLCGLGAAACGGTQGSAADPARGAAAPSAANPATAGTAQSTAARPAREAAEPATGPETAAAGSSIEAKPLSGKVVVIDPGHNGQNFRHPSVINKKVNVLTQWKACDTTGTATANGYSEAAFTWDVSQRLAKILKSRGATVKLTRDGNDGVGPCITERAAIGNKARADAAISVHADGSSPGNRGFHVIMPRKIKGPVDPVVGASEKLGVAVRDAFRSGTGLPYSTYIGKAALDFRNDLGGLNLSTVPKIFVECGNMRNAGEAAKFQQPAFRQKIALSLANGVQDYLQ
ncbi:N-acetylmuramoyl-L-alanine amidase [Streptosporangium becharense]|uniref:N-acetylmuramoyl-L-alanine amidase n=1 Tax=Streptosporangium becharense TaxID=1816182 RepID=A0A7W9IHN9_9ACTN|nr:N-acetylmuramoyl-L-alanine amidase [Streptosporangium becharense]MBB2912400.1 N-acetylmuramoyl-L-alanine amidase [Streptosporangium becharense]MBB5820771.1 N-acetylmuramoyl-L-alanine amidase [Streptosporangium becharense]